MPHSISNATRDRLVRAWPEIIAAMAGGMSVSETLARHDLTRQALAVALADPGMRAEWESAKEASADEFFDRLTSMANTKMAGVDPAHGRTVVDLLKWLAGKRNPKLYADRSQVDVNVKTVDLTRIIQDANARLIASRQAPVLDLPPDQFERLL